MLPGCHRCSYETTATASYGCQAGAGSNLGEGDICPLPPHTHAHIKGSLPWMGLTNVYCKSLDLHVWFFEGHLDSGHGESSLGPLLVLIWIHFLLHFSTAAGCLWSKAPTHPNGGFSPGANGSCKDMLASGTFASLWRSHASQCTNSVKRLLCH